MTPDEERIEKEFQAWVATFDNYMRPDDGKLFVIRKPSDIVKVFEELDDMGV